MDYQKREIKIVDEVIQNLPSMVKREREKREMEAIESGRKSLEKDIGRIASNDVKRNESWMTLHSTVSLRARGKVLQTLRPHDFRCVSRIPS